VRAVDRADPNLAAVNLITVGAGVGFERLSGSRANRDANGDIIAHRPLQPLCELHAHAMTMARKEASGGLGRLWL